nr:tRNA-dihydrouridine synthase [Melioribacteraceae bacterium]
KNLLILRTIYIYTSHLKTDEPDYDLLIKLSSTVKVPVFAEGRINTPQVAKRIMEKGAFALVVGSAITRPTLITEWFVNAIK